MKRQTLLLVAGILGCLIGFAMVVVPARMLGAGTAGAGDGARHVLRWMGCIILSVGAINILSRNDPGSPALVGVMVGNVLVHALGLIVQLVDYATGFIRLPGIVAVSVVHVVLLVAFLYCLRGTSSAPTRASA